MNGPSTTKTDPVALEVAGIEDALDALLTAATKADLQPPMPLHQDRGPVQASVSAIEYLRRLDTWTETQREADKLLKRPVGEAVRQAIRTLGERLHEMGGQGLMTDVLDRVADRDHANAGRRSSIMDHRWDGIGRTPTTAGWSA